MLGGFKPPPKTLLQKNAFHWADLHLSGRPPLLWISTALPLEFSPDTSPSGGHFPKNSFCSPLGLCAPRAVVGSPLGAPLCIVLIPGESCLVPRLCGRAPVEGLHAVQGNGWERRLWKHCLFLFKFLFHHYYIILPLKALVSKMYNKDYNSNLYTSKVVRRFYTSSWMWRVWLIKKTIMDGFLVKSPWPISSAWHAAA